MYHHDFCDGSRTEDIFFTLSVPENGEKWEFFWGMEGLGEGKEEDPEEESPRSYIDYFCSVFSKNYFLPVG